jgi:glycosyltransferase involved in cell wall biosynthesis
MAAPTVSIAIPTYNRAAMLRNILTCMTRQQTDGTFTFEVLVIDDASTDDTAGVVREISRTSPVPVQYILEQGRGYTRVLNTAVARFRGEWLAFFDDDQMTHSAWLKQLLSVAVEQGADMVGGPVLLDLPDSVLAGIGPVCRDLYGESPEVRKPELFTETPPLPSGGNRLVRRRVFERVGTFDEKMLTGGCDRDFLLRAIAAGVSTGWAPGAAGTHLIPPERISYKHIKWYSLQWGCSFAYIDWKRFGAAKTVFSCIGRTGQALLMNLPLMLMASVTKNKSETLDRQALLWRAVGYTRKTLNLVAPGLFRQEKFFSRVEFRRARDNT